MTAHAHDPAAHTDSGRPSPAARRRSPATSRPRWLVPGLLVAALAAGLVLAGVLSLTTVIYAGLFGGMILMHVGGHGGHGGYGGGPGGHAGLGDDPTSDDTNLSARSSGSKAPGSVSGDGLDDRAETDRHGNKVDDHDQHSSHGCH